jgi:hypothetical protein
MTKRRLFLTNGSKYKLHMMDGSQTKGVWSTDKFCWTTNLGRNRIPVELVRRVAVLDSTVSDRSADFGWFSTGQCLLDKWRPRHPGEWINPIRGRALGRRHAAMLDSSGEE